MTNLRDRWLMAALTLLAVGLFYLFRDRLVSADLLAWWLAGHFLAEGQPGLIYPPDTGLFVTTPPQEWYSYLREAYGYSGPVYPFLYPPLWAWLSATCCQSLDFATLELVVLALNSVLLCATVWLAARMTAGRMNQIVFAFLSVFILAASPIGADALMQGQAQILVAFLMVLSAERGIAGASRTAGAALALAASIKLYPAAFAVFFLAAGQRRALGWFVLCGGLLGGLSILTTGWPLHRDFLAQLSSVSSTLLVSRMSVSLEVSLAQITLHDALSAFHVGSQSDRDWYAMPKDMTWRMVSGVFTIGVFAALGLWFSRVGTLARAALWPLILTLATLALPFGWVYYYIPAAAFAPSLLAGPGRIGGAVFLGLGFLPVFLPVARRLNTWEFLIFPFPLATTLGLVLWATGFFLKAHRRGKSDKTASGDLRPLT